MGTAICISKKRTPHGGKSWKFRHLGKSETGYIYPHYHCAKCDDLIEKGTEFTKKQIGQKKYPGFDYFCSEKCADVIIGKAKSAKRRNYLTWILIAAIPVIFVLLFVFFPM